LRCRAVVKHADFEGGRGLVALRVSAAWQKSCKYILKSQQPTVEQLLYQLHQRITLQEGRFDDAVS
jgi:hypothetical protein